jgi:HPt (histidine-containing phosphotransfer) domain-containing protein
MIDWAQVDELRNEMGSAFAELVDAFLEEVDDGILRVDPSSDAKSQASALHFLKGAALNLGFRDFARLCAEGEDNANRNHLPAVDVAQLSTVYQQSRAEFLAGLALRAA